MKKVAVGVSTGLAIVAVLLVAVSVSHNNKAVISNREPKGATVSAVDSAQLLILTNEDRAKANLPALTLSTELNKSAADKCQDEITLGYYAHVSPAGKQWYDFIKPYTYYQTAGENLADGTYTASSLEQAWMASPEHKANILSPQFTQIGIAVCKNGTLQDIVEHFIEPIVPQAPIPSCNQPAVALNRYKCSDPNTYPPCIDGENPYDGSLYCF